MLYRSPFHYPAGNPYGLRAVVSIALFAVRLLVGVSYVAPSSLSAVDRLNAYGPFGTGGTTVRQYENAGVLVTNSTGAAVNLLFTNPSGGLTVPFVTVAFDPPLTGTGYVAMSSINVTTPSSTAYNLVNGATIWVDLGRVELKCPASADMGLHMAIFVCNYRLDGGPVITSTLVREIAILAGGSSDPLYGLGAGVVGSGIPIFNTGGTTNGTQVSVGNITLTPVVTSGSVSVGGLRGNYSADLIIDGIVVDNETRTGADPASEGPVWTWATADAFPYLNKPLQIRVNGVLVWAQTIGSGPGFDIVLSFDPENPEYLQPVYDLDGNVVPIPGDAVTNENEQRPPVPEAVGGNPQAETTDETLSVADHYRATRKAVQDALNGPAGPRFNPDAAQAPMDNAIGDIHDTAEGPGTFLGGLASTLSDMTGGTGPISGPGLSGAAPLSLTVWGYTATIPVAPSAPIIRGVLMLFLAIFFFVNVVKVIRGAFASAN